MKEEESTNHILIHYGYKQRMNILFSIFGILKVLPESIIDKLHSWDRNIVTK